MTLSGAARDGLLAGLAGVAGVELDTTAREIDGERFGLTLRPEGAEALASCLAALSARQTSALVRGGGSRGGPGAPVRGAPVVLETGGLSGIQTLDGDEGVMCAGAGTPLAELAAAAREAGWELPLDPPGATGTLGGALAAAAIGPCFAAPRDVVLGLGVATAQGRLTRCGGRVVKNVTGYDLAKLYTGSLGTLGVITSAWLRLRPVPERRLALRAEPTSGPDGPERILEAARLPGVRVAAETGQGLVFEVAAEAASVERTARALGSALGARPVSGDPVGELRALQADGTGLLFRIAHLPSRARAVREALGSPLRLGYPARGLVWVDLAAADPAQLARRRAEVERAAAAGAGCWQLEGAPPWARAEAAAFPHHDLMLALKARYDPAGILNPGRLGVAS